MSKTAFEGYPYVSNYIKIRGSVIHYIDYRETENSEIIFLFLHGNPTSSYLWRNIIPYLKNYGRCIAPDLIGFGKSDKPDIEYSFQDHLSYVESFIKQLNLENIVFIIHDWGGAIGFEYSRCNPHQVKGIAFMETFYKPMKWDSLDPFGRWLFKKFRSPRMGAFLNGNLNAFVRFILPLSIIRRLTSNGFAIYNTQFKSKWVYHNGSWAGFKTTALYLPESNEYLLILSNYRYEETYWKFEEEFYKLIQ